MSYFDSEHNLNFVLIICLFWSVEWLERWKRDLQVRVGDRRGEKQMNASTRSPLSKTFGNMNLVRLKRNKKCLQERILN